MDYILNVYEDDKFLFAIGGSHMNYDNVIWWQLEELISVVENYKDYSKDELIKEITARASYFKLIKCGENEYKDEPKIDIGKRIIEKPYVPIFNNFDEVCEETPINKIIKKEDGYYSEYDVGDQYKMSHVEFDTSLLYSTIVTFEEFLKIAKFIISIQDLENDTDFILNNSLVLRLNSI